VTDVNFYDLTRTALERALPKLLEKVIASGARAVVRAGSSERVEALNAALWTYDPDSFLPHGSSADGNPGLQPIWLTTLDENPNGASFLVLTDGVEAGEIGRFERCLDLFDGNDEAARLAARERWTAARNAGHRVAYYAQDQDGRWSARSNSPQD